MEEIRVHKITKSGYGSKPGQIPSDLKVPLMIFDYLNESPKVKKSKYTIKQLKAIKEKKTDASYRCPRKGFIPFDILGRLIQSARLDGVPPPGPNVIIDKNGNLLTSPLYLVLNMKDGFVAAFAFLYTNADGSLKLEYLCAAPKFKGSGKSLLMLLKEGRIFKPIVRGVRRLYLNNNSGIPGFYSKYGFVKVGKTRENQYMKQDSKGRLDENGQILLVPKILNVYKGSMLPSVSPSVIPKKLVSKNSLRTRVLKTKRKPLPPPKTPRRQLRYQLRRRTIY